MMPLISVVIPLYNKEPHIKRAIDSVLSQKVQNFEIVVIDDGSTDKGVEIVKGFTDPRIRLIQQENAGVSAARNRGIEEAKADLIAFLDADDEWTPIFIETVLQLRKKYPKAGAYATSYMNYYKCKYVKPRCKAIPASPWEGEIEDYFESIVKGHPPFCASCICIPKFVMLDVGGFPEGIWLGEDSDMWARIALNYTIAFSWDVGATYYLDSVNMATKKKRPVKELPFIQVAEELMKDGRVLKNETYIKKYIKDIEFKFGLCNWNAKEYHAAVFNFSKCGRRFVYRFLYHIMSLEYQFFSNIIKK